MRKEQVEEMEMDERSLRANFLALDLGPRVAANLQNVRKNNFM